MSSLPPIAIISFGDDHSRRFVERLTSKSFLHQSPKFLVRDFSQTKDAIVIFMALQKFFASQSPLVLLISSFFFETIWVSPYKTKILNLILNYSTKLCTHIWMEGVTEDYVERHSTALLRNDDGFRRLIGERLSQLSPKELLDTVVDSITDISSQSNEEVGYFSVQDDEPHPLKEKPSTKKEKSISPPSSISSNTSTSKSASSSKKKKGGKKGSSNHYAEGAATISFSSKRFLKDLTQEEKIRIANLLNPTNGVSFIEIAYMYGFSKKDINIMESSRKTISLIDEIVKQTAKAKIHDFRKKCTELFRLDVVNEIDEILSKK